jgi:hypothetical protein
MVAQSQSPGSKSNGLKQLAFGIVLGAILGAVLAWYASQMKQEEEQQGTEATPMGTGDMVSLGIEVLGLVRTLFRMLKRI